MIFFVIYVRNFLNCRLKLFLEQFGILSCVLNSELPASSRCHAISQFNEDVYKILIASDEKSMEGENNKNRKEAKKRLELLQLL